MGVPMDDSVHRDVVFVIDSSACLSGILPSLLKEYIQPCIEYFCGGKLPEVEYGIQNGPTRYGLVTINSPVATYRPVCTYYPITCSPSKLIKWIQDIRLESGLVGNSLLLSEGLAAAMELAQLMESTKESCLNPNVTFEKHCVLILNQPPSSHPCVESLKHSGKTVPQLIKLLIEDGTHVSVISPRCLTSVRDLIEKTLPTPSSDTETTPLDELDHSLHMGHLVLLRGFQIQSIKERKKALHEVKVDTSEQAITEPTMDTNPPSIKIKEEPTSLDFPMKVEPSFPRSDSPLTLSTALPVKQEPIAEPIAKPIAPSTSVTPFIVPSSQSLPKMVAAAGATNLNSVAAGSSSHNPIQITSPMGQPDKMFSTVFSHPPTSGTPPTEVSSLASTTIKSETLPSFVTPPSQPTSAQNSPLVASSQAITMTRTTSGGIPSSMGSNQPNLEMAMKAAQMAVRMAQVSSQGSNNAVSQQRPGSTPAAQTQINSEGMGAGPQTNVGQNQQLGGMQPGAQNPGAIGQSMQSSQPQPQAFPMNPAVSGAQDYSQQQQRVPTPPMPASGVMSQAPPTSMNAFQQQGTAQQPNTQPQQIIPPRPTIIWNGIMELAEVHENQRQMRQIRCSVITNKSDVVQEVQPKTWPQKMTMNAYPKAMFNSIMTGMDFNRGTANLKTVNFQFQDSPQSVSMLRQLMVIDTAIKMFAIVHLVGANTGCPIKALILVWNEKQKQFTGLIPLDQEKFVIVVKQVLIHRQRQQAGLQQSAGGGLGQSYSQPSSSYTQSSSLQQSAMATVQGSIMGQQNQTGMMGQRGGMMGQSQQQQSFSQGGMMGQQTQAQNQGGMLGQQTQASQNQGGMMGQQTQASQNQGGMMGQQTQAQNQGGMMGQQTQAQNQGGMMGQQTQAQNQGGIMSQQTQAQNQGGMLGQQTQAQNQGGIMGQQTQASQNQGGMMSQQTQAQNQGGMMGQQTQAQNQGGMMGQQTQASQNQGGMMGQQTQAQNQGGMMGQQAQAQNQGGMMGQQTQAQNQGGMMGQQTQASQNQGGMMGQQTQAQNQGMMGQQTQAQNQGMMGQQTQAQNQGMMGQQTQAQNQGMMGQQTQASQNQGGMMGQQSQQGVMNQQQGMMGQQSQQGGQGRMSQQGVMGQPINQAQHQQQNFGQSGMTGQHQQEKIKIEKFLKVLIQAKPEQYESLFQRLRITTPEAKQQWLVKASQYKQQLIQQQQQQQQATNRMMMAGGGQQGMQQQLQMGHSMQQPMNQGGQVFNRPGVPQSMGGIRQTNQMPPHQQQHNVMPPGYNQWQGQQR